MSSQTKDIALEIGDRLASLPAQDTASLRGLRRDFSRRLAKAPDRQMIDLPLCLLTRRSMTYRFVAYELVCHHREALGPAEIERLGQGASTVGGRLILKTAVQSQSADDKGQTAC